ncbi:Eco47II family restriction endonuclease [Mesomycoplasma molare]|uniref:Eco47II family restriction endonuclease n=1 Tax=Mesomycoplasma molare TaxID=171288 RepID=A0ABY5TV05_9BACT|nr:Eco47II family restriction endonuclease [Mesomycoplasma molare]UWD34477.1 Eco47II family restriction endonuclease [Mesomycoplasma molare]
MKYNLKFIKEEDFEYHVKKTIMEYGEILKKINLKKFNKNIIDPIKLLFDKNILNKTYKEIIELELHRQRDKSNNNAIGYFHQNIFKYIKNCKIPKEGWDIIYEDEISKTVYYIEMKNKHNTMNSSSAKSTYIRMQNHLLNSKDKEKSICALVEIISKKSDDSEWVITLEKEKQLPNKRIRKISIDKFYEIVTGDKNSFKNLCTQLPKTIEKIITNDSKFKIEKDTVFDELETIDKDILKSLYKLAFKTYEGF